jgi:hypothetical protein
METDPGQYQIPDEGADDPDQEVANNSKPGAPNNLTSQPACNDAYEQDDQQAFVRHMHWPPRNLVRPTPDWLHHAHRQRLRITTVPQSGSMTLRLELGVGLR